MMRRKVNRSGLFLVLCLLGGSSIEALAQFGGELPTHESIGDQLDDEEAALNSEIKQTSTAVDLKQNGTRYVFVQNAQQAVLERNPNIANQYILKLNQANPSITFFSLPPLEQTGEIAALIFSNYWQNNPDLQQTPVNAAIVAHGFEPVGQLSGAETRVFRIANPRYDVSGQSFTYSVFPLNGKVPLSEGVYHNVSLFIG